MVTCKASNRTRGSTERHKMRQRQQHVNCRNWVEGEKVFKSYCFFLCLKVFIIKYGKNPLSFILKIGVLCHV